MLPAVFVIQGAAFWYFGLHSDAIGLSPRIALSTNDETVDFD
jgi:hypothetical protein